MSETTPLSTPLVTPTPNEVVSIINNCDTVTLFDIGIRCNVERAPSTSTSNDGILSVLITGGTSPYTVYWNGVQGNQRLIGVGQASYPVTVVDYYGDYTASTICSLIAPTATPIPTATPMPTATPIAYPNFLCFVSQGSTTTYGPIQFFWNGNTSNVNGKPTWSGTYNGANLSLVWTLQPPRWEINGWTSIPGWNQSQGIPVSTSTSNVPLTNWSIVGGQPATTTMTQGVCPPFVPLRAFVEKQDSTCPNRNNGSITITADAGVRTTGYLYSIDGGQTYSSINIFNNLSPRTYSVVVKDNASPPNITSAIPTQIGIINPNPTVYEFKINLINTYSTGTGNKTFEWKLDITPQLGPGQVVEIRVLPNITNQEFTPGGGTFNNTFIIKKNGNTIINQTNPQCGVFSPIPRPGCNSVINGNQNCVVSLQTIGQGDTLSGITVCDLNITNPQTINGCSTKLEQSGGVNFATNFTLPSITLISGFNNCDTYQVVNLTGLSNVLP